MTASADCTGRHANTDFMKYYWSSGQVRSGKTDSGPINKLENTGSADQKKFSRMLHMKLHTVNKNSFPVLKLKVLCEKFLTL